MSTTAPDAQPDTRLDTQPGPRVVEDLYSYRPPVPPWSLPMPTTAPTTEPTSGAALCGCPSCTAITAQLEQLDPAEACATLLDAIDTALAAGDTAATEELLVLLARHQPLCADELLLAALDAAAQPPPGPPR